MNLYQTNFGPTDWIIVGVSLVSSIAIGLWANRYVGNLSDYLVAGRTLRIRLALAPVLQTINFFERREDFSEMISNEKKEWAADDADWTDFRGLISAFTANIRARSQRAERPAVYFIFWFRLRRAR